MQSIFINFTNHPSDSWEQKQKFAAEKYGRIKDVAFPSVKADSTEEEIAELGEQYYKEIISYHPNAVLCQGEFTLTVYVLRRLQESGIKVVAACTERKVDVEGNVKKSVFEFVQFREYYA